MKNWHIIISTALLAIFSAKTFAQAECDKYNTSYDQTYCFAKLFLESDKELNTVYVELRNQLKDPVRKQLTEVQRQWIKYRNEKCERNGSINVDCNYRVNLERAEYLRDRSRECKTGTCRNDMITQPGWN